MPESTNYYTFLKVAENASFEVIKAACRSLTQKHHPDKNPSDPNAVNVMQRINEAKNVLLNPALRKDYDAALETRRRRLAEELNRKMQAEARESVKTPPPPPPPPPPPKPKPRPVPPETPRSAASASHYAKSHSQPGNSKAHTLLQVPLSATRHVRRYVFAYALAIVAAITAFNFVNKVSNRTTPPALDPAQSQVISKSAKTEKNASSIAQKIQKRSAVRSQPKAERASSADQVIRHDYDFTSKSMPISQASKRQQFQRERRLSNNKNPSGNQKIESIVAWPD